MQIRHALKALAAVFAAMVVLSSPASADIWWETEVGTMYWHDSVGGTAVFKFDESGEMFVEGIAAEYNAGRMYDANSGWIKSWKGKFTGFWYDYEGTDKECSQSLMNDYGKAYAAWGRVEITFTDLHNFTLRLGECDEPLSLTIKGTEGQ